MSVAGIASQAHTEDEQLVAAVRRGDDRAFEALYERYQRRITAYVYGMVNDHGRAEDLTQEIFVSALRRMRATERPIAFKPWVYEIARNACIDQFRRTRRTEEVSFDAEADSGGFDAVRLGSMPTPDAAIDAKQQIDDLRGAFGGLSDSHHEILVMRELEGRSYREIGERLGLSRPSVESTLFRARRRLTEEYEELVSGERCRRVSEMLVSGAESLGARDEKRLARHVAHCQPCRRQAFAAGVDTATLTGSRRGIARVAALLPLPAFLRFRGSSTAQWSNTAAAFAEPAAGWTKAAVAAAVLVAGGAGVAGHQDRTVRDLAPAAPLVAPQPEAPRAPSAKRLALPQRSFADAPAEPARAASPQGAFERESAPAVVLPDLPGGQAAPAGSEPVAPADRPAVAPPSSADLPPESSDGPAAGFQPSSPPPAAAGDPEPSDVVVNAPRSTGELVDQLERSVTVVDDDLGRVVQGATGSLGLND